METCLDSTLCRSVMFVHKLSNVDFMNCLGGHWLFPSRDACLSTTSILIIVPILCWSSGRREQRLDNSLSAICLGVVRIATPCSPSGDTRDLPMLHMLVGSLIFREVPRLGDTSMRGWLGMFYGQRLKDQLRGRAQIMYGLEFRRRSCRP